MAPTSDRITRTATVVSMALALAFLTPDPLLASAVQGEGIGKNLGDLLAGWAAAVFSGTVGSSR